MISYSFSYFPFLNEKKMKTKKYIIFIKLHQNIIIIKINYQKYINTNRLKLHKNRKNISC